MSDDFNWDDFANGEYVKLANVGDEVVGLIISLDKHKYDDTIDPTTGAVKTGQTVPKVGLRLRDGTEKTWTVGHQDAIKQLVAHKPQLGQILKAKISRDLGPGKGKGKLYDLEVRSPGATPAPAADPVVTEDESFPF